MKKSIRMIAIAGMLGMLAMSGTAFAALARWQNSAQRGPNPNPFVPYSHSASNNGVVKTSSWFVGWNFGTATMSSNNTNQTPHQSVTVRCTRPGFADQQVVGQTFPSGNPVSGFAGPETNWANCPANFSATTGMTGIYF